MNRNIFLIVISLVLVSCGTESIVAPSGGSIIGIVKDERTQSPLANAQVYTVPGSSTVFTNDSGSYRINDVTPGDYLLKGYYRDDQYLAYAVEQIRVGTDSVTVKNLVVKKGSPFKGAISGTVLDEQKNPVEGARVFLLSKRDTVKSNEKGQFIFMDVAVDSQTVVAVYKDLIGRSRTPVAADEINNVTIVIGPQDETKGWIMGRVTLGGKPMAGSIVRVRSIGAIDTTDSDGRYHLRNVPMGQHVVRCSHDHYFSKEVPVDVTMNNQTNCDVELGLGPSIQSDSLELYLTFSGNLADSSEKLHTMVEIAPNKFVDDRFGNPGQAIEFNGKNGIMTRDGAAMNYFPITIGMWLYIPQGHIADNMVFGKTDYPGSAGVMAYIQNDVLTLIRKTDHIMDYTQLEFKVPEVPRDTWFWLGFSLQYNNAYATINGTTTKYYNFAGLRSSNNGNQFGFGFFTNSVKKGGFVGRMDKAVVYSCFKTIDQLRDIMEIKD